MSVDLRTELNDCDTVTGWTDSNKAPSVGTLNGQRYEGTGNIETQHTVSVHDECHTTQLSGGGGTFSLDLSVSSIYVLVKDNLIADLTTIGLTFVIGDGTNLIGYRVGSNDQSPGFALPLFYRCFKLDVSQWTGVVFAGSYVTFTGSQPSLNHATITQVGVGTEHLAKAQGNINNLFIDRISHHLNSGFGLQINGGTVGTPETMADVVADDITNGWGMINNISGKQYGFLAPVQWGEPSAAADAYFEATDEQWYFFVNGSGNFNCEVAGNATDTISWVLTRVVIVNASNSTVVTFDLSDVNADFMQVESCVFTNVHTITLPTQDVDKFVNNCVFNNCRQVIVSTCDMDGCTFNGSADANGAIIWDEDDNPDGPVDQTNMTFNSDGTGHAIEVNPTGAGPFVYDIDGYTFDGFASQAGTDTNRVFFINPVTLSADITINLSNSQTLNPIGGGTDNFSHRDVASYTGTLIIQQVVNLTVQVNDSDNNGISGARVRIEEDPGGTLISDGSADGTGEHADTFSFSTDQAVLVKVRLKGFKPFRTTGTITSTGLTVTATMLSDRIVDMP